MDYQLTKPQQIWWKSAGMPERTAFLAKGPAGVPSLVNNKTFEPVYRPMVRGVLLDEEAQPDYASALRIAEGELAKFQAEVVERGYSIDERALGIDDTQRNLGEALQKHKLCIDWIIPLCGMSNRIPEAVEEWLEDTAADEFKFAEQMPALARVLKDRDNDEDGDFDGREGRYRLREEVSAAFYEDRAFGCLIRVSQPVPRDRFGSGVGFSWGYTSFETLYGESYEAAMQAAIAWGKKTWAEAVASLPDRSAA